MKVSIPETTVLDLVASPVHGGGLSNIATVLGELLGDGLLDIPRLASLAKDYPAAVPQRTGWLLERVAEEVGAEVDLSLSDLVAALAARLIRDIAAGRHPVYVTTEDEVSPAQAARLLGVSRQYVDRLLADGRLPYTRKPNSTHRTITVAKIEALVNERSRRRSNTDKTITALLEGGLEY